MCVNCKCLLLRKDYKCGTADIAPRCYHFSPSILSGAHLKHFKKKTVNSIELRKGRK